jgi:hypothetical protein
VGFVEGAQQRRHVGARPPHLDFYAVGVIEQDRVVGVQAELVVGALVIPQAVAEAVRRLYAPHLPQLRRFFERVRVLEPNVQREEDVGAFPGSTMDFDYTQVAAVNEGRGVRESEEVFQHGRKGKEAHHKISLCPVNITTFGVHKNGPKGSYFRLSYFSAMALWHLTSEFVTRLLLWRTGPAAFRVMQYDDPAEVLTNADYFLFDAKYEAVLRQLHGQITVDPVTVTDGVRHLVWDHYLEVRIHRSVEADAIWNHGGLELEMYRFGEQSIFVSEALKAVLEQVPQHGLYFSAGLSEFA